MAEIRPNNAKHKLQRGGVATIISGANTPDMIDSLGPLGFDIAWIEGEHGPVDFKDIPDLTRACDIWGISSLVRVNLNVPGVIYRTLDVGAQGVVVPHVNTAEEARAAVDAAKFAPIGARGMYSSRQGHGVPDYLHRANDETMLVVLIEDIVAVGNLAEILTVDHIDVFFVAPGDLAQSMGHIGQVSHPEVQAVVDKAVAQITAAGRVAGGLANDSTVEDVIAKGTRMVMTTFATWIDAGARGFLDKVASASG